MKFYEALKKGWKDPSKNKVVLYVGASHGVTVNKLAKSAKIIYAIDKSKTTTKELIKVAKQHKNIAPILADANLVEEYKDRIGHKIDFLFQDIAQKDQVRIFKKLVEEFHPEVAWLALKCKGIDSNKTKEEVLEEAKKELKNCTVLDLAPEVKDHYLLCV